MNLSIPKSLKIALLVVVPTVLFGVARERASWRPHIVADVGFGNPTISPNEEFAAGTRGNNVISVSVYDLSRRSIIKKQVVKSGGLIKAFSPDGKKLAMVAEFDRDSSPSGIPHGIGVGVLEPDSTYRAFEAIHGSWATDISTQLLFSSDGKKLWLASRDNLRSWDVGSGKLTFQLLPYGHADSLMYDRTFIEPNCRLCFRYSKNGYSVWDIRSRKRLLEKKLSYFGDSLNISPNGRFMASMTKTPGGEIYVVLDALSGKELWRPSTSPTFIGHNAIIVKDNTYEFHEARTGKLLYRLPAVPGATPLAFGSPKWLYSQTISGELLRQRIK